MMQITQLEIDNFTTHNRQRAKQSGLELDVTRISVEIPKDTHITIDQGRVEVVDKVRLARNNSELNTLFTYFCKRNVHPYTTTDSAGVLRGAIEEAMEKYLNYFASDVPRIVLYKHNQPLFVNIIRKALDRYGKQQEQKPKQATYQTNTWTLPESRLYNSEQVQNNEQIFNHALMPYLERKNASKQERDFALWIDRQNDIVDWWYKNGDDGKQHFAVPYSESDNRPHCFYVDFIIRLKNGTICLFDTKTVGSDLFGVEKNNALWEYCKKHNYVGGVLIQENGNWYFPNALVDNITNLNGWTRLDLTKL